MTAEPAATAHDLPGGDTVRVEIDDKSYRPGLETYES